MARKIPNVIFFYSKKVGKKQNLQRRCIKRSKLVHNYFTNVSHVTHGGHEAALSTQRSILTGNRLVARLQVGKPNSQHCHRNSTPRDMLGFCRTCSKFTFILFQKKINYILEKKKMDVKTEKAPSSSH